MNKNSWSCRRDPRNQDWNILSNLLGNSFHSGECKHHKKNLLVVEQLNADECVPKVLTPADLLDIWYCLGESARCCVLMINQRPQTGCSPKIQIWKCTIQKHMTVSQDQFKNAPKYFQRDETIYMAVTFNKTTKILTVLPPSLSWS